MVVIIIVFANVLAHVALDVAEDVTLVVSLDYVVAIVRRFVEVAPANVMGVTALVPVHVIIFVHPVVLVPPTQD